MGKKAAGGKQTGAGGAKAGGSNASASTGPQSYTQKYLPMELVEEIVYDSPDINRTASLYSRTDLYKCMTDFLTEMLPDVGFVEDTKWTNVRLACTVLGTGIGLWSVARLKFPADKDLIFWSVIAFMVVFVVVAIIDMYVLGPDSFFSLQDKDGTPVYCGLSMDEFSSNVCWTIRGGSKNAEATQLEKCISHYFDADGYLVVENMFDDFCTALDTHCGHIHIVWENRPDYNLEDNKKESKKKK